MIPAKRSPDGFVAQRMIPDEDARGDGIRRPWLLASFNLDRGGLHVELLTDDDVTDWPELNEG